MKREYKLEQVAGEIAQAAIIESSAIGIPNDHIEPWVKDFAIGVAVATGKWADSHPQWTPVDEELPNENGKTGQSISVWATNGLMSCEMRYNFDTKKWTDMWGDPFDITHWMPLPQPPRKEVEK